MADGIAWAAQLHSLASRHRDRTAVWSVEAPLSYDGLARNAASLANQLRTLGVGRQELIGTFLSNGRPAVAASYGLMCTGVAEVALNPAISDEDLQYAVGLVGLNKVVAPRAAARRFARLGVKVIPVEDLDAATDSDDLLRLPPVPASRWGKVLFTSGTTGRPKAIVHSHGGRWLATALLRAHLPFQPGPDDRILLMTSFVHGASLLTYAYLDSGASVALCDGVDVALVRHLLETRAVNALFAPPTVLAKIVAALEGCRFPDVRAVFTGTATLKPSLYLAACAMFGPVIRVTYGMTEIFNPITVLPAADCDGWYRNEARQGGGACLGWPAAGVELQILPAGSGEGEQEAIGEIAVRARHMMVGTIAADGFTPHPPQSFHRTGDQGMIDRQGRLFITGRGRDVIKTGGYKVYPEEIERLFPEEVAVVGFPSDYWGEIVVAVGEGEPPAHAADWSDVTRHLRPRAFVAVERFPRNAQGKIQRAVLREQICSHYRLTDGPNPRLDRVG